MSVAPLEGGRRLALIPSHPESAPNNSSRPDMHRQTANRCLPGPGGHSILSILCALLPGASAAEGESPTFSDSESDAYARHCVRRWLLSTTVDEKGRVHRACP